MEKWIVDHVADAYRAPDPEVWTGRTTTPEQGAQYWYQNVQLRNWSEGLLPGAGFGIIGYVCEEGVRRNQGRLGAAAGAKSVRERIARMAWHHAEKTVVDYGDVVCVGEELENAQMQLALMVLHQIEAGQVPIVLGGGHDVAYGHFCGIRAATEGKNVGIINFDAHFDLRPVTGEPNSGTPFNQILDEGLVDYLVLGIQQQANTAELFTIAEDYGVEYVLAQHCRTYQLPTIIHTLERFLDRNDHVYLSIDLDGFSSAYAPGVSAPSPYGFSPAFVMAVLEYLLASGKVISVDLAEMNPVFDVDGSTARLAAGLVDVILRG
ncbi:formimidoylglutamase [Neolewinella aurantiaca]|uniref:Formimidoylglutamase n=1 Tax=Neolewinella aurantiaca TaxID=2602767 RepID=A0A5C7FW06_9BACT|nr:formimidoylglutamase [Neolewinella aurantiaca]TXF90564.1 formimidoylglutamase [Neolewinella aurantiaca]